MTDLFHNIYGNEINLIEISLDCLDNMWAYSSDERFYEHFEFDVYKSRDETRDYLLKLTQR